VAVVLFDIDSFKQIDDTHGREAGDAVLREVTRRVLAAVRAEDILGRWGDAAEGKVGGEQFLLVLPQTGIDGACVVGERVRSAIAAAPFPVGDRQIEITVSGGCAAGAEAPVGLVRRADTALCQAKEAGCNRLVAANSPSTTPVHAGRRLRINRDAV
jgi:two-component system cell cycle response regulator